VGNSNEINETILERLVVLNAERATEERNGHIRWLRREYQAPEQVQSTQTTLTGIGDEAETVITPIEQQKWPTQPKDQLAAIRDEAETVITPIEQQKWPTQPKDQLAAIRDEAEVAAHGRWCKLPTNLQAKILRRNWKKLAKISID
jgi:hypothetical protein